ncbi:hypothetical protein [Methanolobus sp.]|jgi:hypothetical protein|uniref:hypothetical protein n=1 Tax=Methanolobus sp. TaxID=1874737 RepID=UPI0025DB3AA7|nr:hypothetical protein [Methanolobus sp.]
MKQKLLKAIACLSLVLMVFSAMAPGAFADVTGTASDADKFSEHSKMRNGSRGGPGMDRGEAVEAMEFDSEDQELEFVVEKTTESFNYRIERLNEMLENIDEMDNENITEESIEEQITELETLLEDIEAAETLDDFKAIMEEAKESMMENMPEKGERPAMEEMEFDSDEEEMEFIVEKATESINHNIEKLNEMLENIDEIDDESVTEESIEEQIAELETLQEDIESATTLDELKEIIKEARENNPQPHGHGHGGEFGPMNPDFEEGVKAE